MAVQSKFIPIGISLFFSVLGMLLWQYEIMSRHSGEGLYWLDGELISPYAISIFPVLSFLSPFILKKKNALKKILLAMGILYLTSLFCFLAGREMHYMIYGRLFFAVNYGHLVFFFMLLLFVLLGFGFWYTTFKLLQPVRKIKIIVVTGIAFAVIPLSLLTNEIFPMFSDTDWVNTVKSGYPVFWITVLLGIAGMNLSASGTILKETNNKAQT